MSQVEQPTNRGSFSDKGRNPCIQCTVDFWLFDLCALLVTVPYRSAGCYSNGCHASSLLKNVSVHYYCRRLACCQEGVASLITYYETNCTRQGHATCARTVALSRLYGVPERGYLPLFPNGPSAATKQHAFSSSKFTVVFYRTKTFPDNANQTYNQGAPPILFGTRE
jgi:hypothetical protein